MAKTVKLAEYLFARLKQLGVNSVHGVPGDYNLTLLDYIEPAGLTWVGNANELNAGYAADGYARIKGIGALVTTFGVGELSAINAIACAFTERAPLIHIVGTPPRDSQDQRLMIHHTMGDGNYRHFGQMAAHVTIAQTNLLDPRTSPKQIDEMLEQCLIHSRPVYIEVPVDMVPASVVADGLDQEITIAEAVTDPAHEETLSKVLEKVYAAKQPVIIVDGETRPLGLMKGVQQLIDSTKWPTFTTAFGKGLVDETSTNVYGIYEGIYAPPKTKEFMDSADLVLCFGPHYSSTNSYNWTSVPRREKTIAFTPSGIDLQGKMYRNIPVKHILSRLLEVLDSSRVKRYEEGFDSNLGLSRDQPLTYDKKDIIKHDKVWRIMQQFLRPGDIILTETGTVAYGFRNLKLPKHARFFVPSTWLSIGYMLPACQGAALAQRELASSSQYHDIKNPRTILLIGDGSFQMTVQELATVIHHKLNVIVFLINNDGYTIERVIHGLKQHYNDITPWRYLRAPGLFGASEDTFTASVKTYGELDEVMQNDKMVNGTALRMVEIVMDREDVPVGPLTDLLKKQLGTSGK